MLDIRKHFLTMMMVKHWNRVLTEAVESPSLEILKSRLTDRMVQSKMILP